MLRTFSILAGLLGLTAILSAQGIDPDTFKVNYFSKGTASLCEDPSGVTVCADPVPAYPDGTVRITNVGTSEGNLCAYIYVFAPNQEMSECCGCKLTPDGLRTLSVNTDITGNPLTGASLSSGAIKIVSAATTGGACPLPDSLTSTPKPEPGVRAWGTQIQHSTALSAYTVTETAFLDSGLSVAELAALTAQCYGIVLEGSGAGQCSCGEGESDIAPVITSANSAAFAPGVAGQTFTVTTPGGPTGAALGITAGAGVPNTGTRSQKQ